MSTTQQPVLLQSGSKLTASTVKPEASDPTGSLEDSATYFSTVVSPPGTTLNVLGARRTFTAEIMRPSFILPTIANALFLVSKRALMVTVVMSVFASYSMYFAVVRAKDVLNGVTVFPPLPKMLQ